MNSPLKVGVTGGIGAGKSTVCRIFQHLGIPVYDADSAAKNIANEDPRVRQSVIGLFGTKSYQGSVLDRKYIASKVFNHPENLARLNSIIHPRVAEDFVTWLEKHRSFPYIIKEAALLFETGSFRQLDFTIAVTAPEELRIKRILKRDPQRNASEIKDIMSRQLDEEEKKKLASYVISNDEKSLIIPQVNQLHFLFLKENPGNPLWK
ncbi:MAG: dephospho-CoA kinase [Cyclobacteriaceae bacterium]|nr:dephospho-CoA kinase [Cyclobacteriaceae bacterium]